MLEIEGFVTEIFQKSFFFIEAGTSQRMPKMFFTFLYAI